MPLVATRAPTASDAPSQDTIANHATTSTTSCFSDYDDDHLETWLAKPSPEFNPKFFSMKSSRELDSDAEEDGKQEDGKQDASDKPKRHVVNVGHPSTDPMIFMYATFQPHVLLRHALGYHAPGYHALGYHAALGSHDLYVRHLSSPIFALSTTLAVVMGWFRIAGVFFHTTMVKCWKRCAK